MPHAAKVIADSVSDFGIRLTTMEITFPRIILAEFNTHRMFSRNSASSRAIPVEKMIRMVEQDPYIPTHWGKNQKGMQADVELQEDEQREAELEWLLARDHAVTRAKRLLDVGVHKQITNRLLEPFMWHTVIVTSTEWSNWNNLRDNPQAHPEIAKIARMMNECLAASKPAMLDNEWHLPYVSASEMVNEDGYIETIEFWKKVSIGRCARVSYLTHDGKRDPKADVELGERLLASGHMSPFEHVARPMTEFERSCSKRDTLFMKNGRVVANVSPPQGMTWDQIRFFDTEIERIESKYFCGNFNGWVQARKMIDFEDDFIGKGKKTHE